MRHAWDTALTGVVTFVPKLVGFVLILVVGIIVAKVLSELVGKVLSRVGFDRVIERTGIGKALDNSSSEPSGIAAKLVYYALMLFVLHLAFAAFGPNPISVLLASVIAFLPLVAIIIIVVSAAIAAAVKNLIRTSLGAFPTAMSWPTSQPCSSWHWA